MKEPSPLVPQGSFESQAKRKSHVRIAVFTILAIHVAALGGFLILGCKPDSKNPDTTMNPPTNDVPAVQPFTNATDLVATNLPSTDTNLLAMPPVVPPVVIPPPTTVAATEHKIAKGDNFSTLAAKYGVTMKAIQEANPTLVPTKLKIDDKVIIPAKIATAPASANGAPAPTVAGDTYKVKSNDTLGKIAKDHHISVKEIQRLNNLTTTQIKVGQVLKMPPHAAGGTPPPVNPVQ